MTAALWLDPFPERLRAAAVESLQAGDSLGFLARRRRIRSG
jgi:hypothetical protein